MKVLLTIAAITLGSLFVGGTVQARPARTVRHRGELVREYVVVRTPKRTHQCNCELCKRKEHRIQRRQRIIRRAIREHSVCRGGLTIFVKIGG